LPVQQHTHAAAHCGTTVRMHLRRSPRSTGAEECASSGRRKVHQVTNVFHDTDGEAVADTVDQS
jgi:hypothetical protein